MGWQVHSCPRWLKCQTVGNVECRCRGWKRENKSSDSKLVLDRVRS